MGSVPVFYWLKRDAALSRSLPAPPDRFVPPLPGGSLFFARPKKTDEKKGRPAPRPRIEIDPGCPALLARAGRRDGPSLARRSGSPSLASPPLRGARSGPGCDARPRQRGAKQSRFAIGRHPPWARVAEKRSGSGVGRASGTAVSEHLFEHRQSDASCAAPRAVSIAGHPRRSLPGATSRTQWFWWLLPEQKSLARQGRNPTARRARQ